MDKWTKLLYINMPKNKIEQAYTHTQWHMNNVWNEMVSCFFCFDFICFYNSHWFIQTISLILYIFGVLLYIFLKYSFSCLFHHIFIGYKKSNVSPSTHPFYKLSKVSKPIAFVNTRCLCFASGWWACPLSYPSLDNTSNIFLDFLVILYIHIFGAKMVYANLCNCCASLIVLQDGCQYSWTNLTCAKSCLSQIAS